ncbi:penicillin-binding protein 1A [Bacteriovorax stolpii]|nr:PBP1A family penicillin-binding protein [Bacteriovorax stolpii]TDP54087.1 penicillin-binding protein 1A [Bacteriovorax stolpii]
MKSLIVKIVFALLGVGLLAGMTGALAFTYFNLDLPKIDKLQDYKPNLASQIISKDGVILAELGLEKREIVEMKDVPQRVIDAFLSAEDDKFFEHKGVDYWGLSRAMFANFKAGRVVQGGSTITQQVAKSLLLSSERSITRKLKDFILAQRIEEKLTKKEILYLYLNQVYLGGGYYGVKAAARGYYNKELKDVTVAEAAMLAGLLVAPGKYSPYVNSHAAKMRQGYVLERMHKLKKISDADYKAAVAEKTVYRLREDELKAGYFTEWVRQKVVDVVGEKSFLVDGFKIKTTLDWELQKVAEEQIQRGIKEIDKRQGYKGPFAHIGSDEFVTFEKKSRINLFKDKSSYFTLNEHNDKVYEFHFDEKAYDEMEEEQNRLSVTSGDENFVPGVNAKDNLPNVLKENVQYEAVVTKIDDVARVVYVSLGGASGIIPFDYFKWAHKRSINENTAYYQEVTKPSTILRVGDLVHVQMVKKSVGVAEYLTKEGTAALSKSKSAALIRAQKYILCRLDQVAEVQGAIFSMDAKTGDILSYVGGSNYNHSKFNRVVQAKRQPGSAFKPILFAAALEHGYNPTTIIMDTPEAMPGFDSASSWKPKNYDGDYKGPVTMRVSLEQSRNIPTIKIADKVGVGTILKFAERIGFNAKLENNLSIALGTFGVSPRDMVTTFAVFANGGRYVVPHGIVSVVDRDGKKYIINEVEKDMKIPAGVEEEATNEALAGNPFTRSLAGKQVYDPRLSYVMTQLLKGVVTSGTGGAARAVGTNVAGKTGTTNDYIDAWFVGYTSNVVAAVWTGFDDNKTLGYGETGGRAPVNMWTEYMKATVRKYGDEPFEVPAGITQAWVDKQTGRKVAPNSPGAILESFAEAPDTPVEEGTGTAQKTRPLGDDEYFENQ